MNTLGEEINEWRQYLTDYFKAQSELFKLQVADKLTVLITSMVTRIVVFAFILMAFLMASLALGFWLGDLMDSKALGFLLTSFLYIFLIVIFLLLRQPLVEKPVIQSVIKLIFENPIEDENK